MDIHIAGGAEILGLGPFRSVTTRRGAARKVNFVYLYYLCTSALSLKLQRTYRLFDVYVLSFFCLTSPHQKGDAGDQGNSPPSLYRRLHRRKLLT